MTWEWTEEDEARFARIEELDTACIAGNRDTRWLSSRLMAAVAELQRRQELTEGYEIVTRLNANIADDSQWPEEIEDATPPTPTPAGERRTCALPGYRYCDGDCPPSCPRATATTKAPAAEQRCGECGGTGLIAVAELQRRPERKKLATLRTEIRRLNKAIAFWKLVAENNTLRGIVRESATPPTPAPAAEQRCPAECNKPDCPYSESRASEPAPGTDLEAALLRSQIQRMLGEIGALVRESERLRARTEGICLACGELRHAPDCKLFNAVPAPAEVPITDAPAVSAGEQQHCAECGHRKDLHNHVGCTYGCECWKFRTPEQPTPAENAGPIADVEEHWESVRDRRRREADSDAGWAYINRELDLLRELEDEVRASAEITGYQMSGVTAQRLLDQLDEIRAERSDAGEWTSEKQADLIGAFIARKGK